MLLYSCNSRRQSHSYSFDHSFHFMQNQIKTTNPFPNVAQMKSTTMNPVIFICLAVMAISITQAEPISTRFQLETHVSVIPNIPIAPGVYMPQIGQGNSRGIVNDIMEFVDISGTASLRTSSASYYNDKQNNNKIK